MLGQVMSVYYTLGHFSSG